MQRNLAAQRSSRGISSGGVNTDQHFTSHPRLDSIGHWNLSSGDAAQHKSANPIATRRDRADEIAHNQMLMAKVDKQMQQDGGWLRWFFGIGKQHGGLSGSKMIHPQSPFSQIIVTTSALLLLYSAVVSSTLVGFLWFADPCKKLPTLEFDMFVDVFFICEIFITFFVGVFHQGEYKDSYRFVAKRYVMGSFVFDLITSIPVSFIEYYTYSKCLSRDESDESANTKALRVIRALKPLKMARILRSIKFLRVLKLLSSVLEYLRIPPFVDRIFKVLVAILLLVHACACCYWLVKESSNHPADVHEWLVNVGVEQGMDASLYDKYVVSFYFVNTVFCTVGFGDISAENASERLFCVLLFYMGTLVFGMLLAEVQDALNKTRQMARERENTVQVLVNFCRKQQMPLHLEKEVVNWIEFTMSHHQDHTSQEELLNVVPPNLHRQLVAHLHKSVLLHTAPFSHANHEQLENLCLDLWSVMKPALFGPFVPIAPYDRPADRMYFVIAGTVILQEEIDGHGHFRSTLHPGDSFGQYALFGNTAWGHLRTKGRAQFASITNVMCLYLSIEMFNIVLDAYPDELREELEGIVASIAQRVQLGHADTVDGTLGFGGQLEKGFGHEMNYTRWHELANKLLKKYRQKRERLDFNQRLLGRAVVKIGNKGAKRQSSLHESESSRVPQKILGGQSTRDDQMRVASAPADAGEFDDIARMASGVSVSGEEDQQSAGMTSEDDSPRGRRTSAPQSGRQGLLRHAGGTRSHGSISEVDEEVSRKDPLAWNGSRGLEEPPLASGSAPPAGARAAAPSEPLAAVMAAMQGEWRARQAALEQRMERFEAEVAGANRATRAELANLAKAISSLVELHQHGHGGGANGQSASTQQSPRAARGDGAVPGEGGAGVHSGSAAPAVAFQLPETPRGFDELHMQIFDRASPISTVHVAQPEGVRFV